MADRTAYIVAARRSPIGHFMGGLSRLPATNIGGQVAAALLDAAQADRAGIDEAYIGHVLQAGCGQNPARQVALAAGVSDTISATTVNKVCGSGLQAAMFADQVIRAGDADLILTGGIESMSNAPFLIREARRGRKFGHTELTDCMLYDGLTNVYDNTIMGALGDYTAHRAGVTREQQDAFACRSHQRAAEADRKGFFDAARVPINVPKAKDPFNTDETIRTDANIDAMSALKPAFGKDGTVTAGNASTISDGAAMVLVASEAGLKSCGVKPLARIVAHVTSGGPPQELFFRPIDACQQVCEKAGWERGSVDLWEINEAFAAQMVACIKALELDEDRVNVHGGAIALGHPIGASGARVLGTLVHGLNSRGGKRGVASLCLGGGNAVAMAVEVV